MKRNIFWLTGILAGALTLGSCTSLGETRVASSIGEEDLKKLQILEADLLDMRMEASSKKTQDFENKISAFLDAPSYNKTFKARLWGLASESAWDRKDLGRLETCVKEISQLNPREARLFTAQGRLEKDLLKAIAILQKALDDEASDEPSWIALELGIKYLDQGQYKESAAAFDLAFSKIYQGYKTLYGPKRDLAFTLKDKAPGASPGQWSTVKELTLEALISLTLQNTNYLDIFTLDKKAPIEPLAKVLMEKGYLPGPAVKLSMTQSRSILAGFLHHIAAERKKKPEMLTQTLNYKTSPIPDLPLDSPYLRAVVYLVQTEIMDLPDGVNFFPEQVPSGLETLQILERLKKVLK